MERIFIYPHDIVRLSGKSYRYATHLLSKIRKYFQKEPHQFVSFTEFCKYGGLDLTEVVEALNHPKPRLRKE